MPEFTGTLTSKAIAAIVDQLDRFITNDSRLRRTQSLNATAIKFFGQGVEAAGVVRTITEARGGANIFSFAVLITDENSGRGRYTIHGEEPTAAGRGFPIPSGGTVIEISGWENIRNFKWINETGETLNWTYGAFQ